MFLSKIDCVQLILYIPTVIDFDFVGKIALAILFFLQRKADYSMI